MLPLRSLLLALAVLTGAVLQADAPRLVNLSTRGQAGTGNNVMICGFVITGSSPKTVLVRAVGPGLSSVLPNTLANPALTLYSGSNALAANDDWLASDAAAMQAVGAFPLAGSSADAALVRSLDPGVYSAIVDGSATADNLALVEIYEITAGAPRLINLSTRAPVGTGNNVLIAGLVVAPGSGTRRLLLRAAGPGIALVAPQLTGLLANPTMTLRDNTANTAVATNNDWGTAAEPAALYAAFSQTGAFPFATGSLDSALVADLPPGLYSLVIAGVGNTSGIALAEIYDLTPEEGTVSVSIAATDPAADESGSNAAAFTLTRTGSTTAALTVSYGIGGSANYGTDYAGPVGAVTFPPGAGTVAISLDPIPDILTEGTETVVLTLNPGGTTYSVGYPTVATVRLTDLPASLFLANLRPTATAATSSAASGTATVLLSPDNNFASVSVTFSNLSSTETVAYVRLGNPGEVGTELARLPTGQVDSAYWRIQASGAYSQADILQALRDGRVFVSIETTNFPAGELRGAFLLASGSQTFTAPAPAPVFDLNTISDTDATRFLTQATFGPKVTEIVILESMGYDAWLADQFAKPASLHRNEIMADFALNNAGGQNSVNGVNTRPGSLHRQAAWWKIALTGEDQLRQRVALALSEIFVISDINGTINNWQEGAANYYDLLARDAFSDFRTLLEDVTLSPMMGIYLSHLRNARAESPTSPQPDENYAREIMQLFTIGLNQLQPDGTLKLDASALPISTYDQATITEMARVFTGWGYYNTNPTNANFRNSPANYFNSMTLYAGFHDAGAKTIVGGTRLPAAQGGLADLRNTLDALANHPNTAPFFCRQLIQHLVTSNPSPAYVYRVAQVFADNGLGGRGDLTSVIRAILTDYEARAAAPAANSGFGKLKEPLLRVTGLLRVGGVTSGTNRYAINNTNGQLFQAPLSAPTVFNFFEPDYVLPGPLAAAGLVAPEFQILTATTAIGAPNYLYNFIFNTAYLGTSLTFSDLLPLATQTPALVARLNLLLAGNNLSPATETRLTTALNALPSATSATDRVRNALYLVVTTPEGAVQQ